MDSEDVISKKTEKKHTHTITPKKQKSFDTEATAEDRTGETRLHNPEILAWSTVLDRQRTKLANP